MGNWVNFNEIRTKVTLAMVLDYYGLKDFKRQGNMLTGACPVHGGDSPRAFHADLDKNLWHCFTRCKKGGNQLDFVAAKEGITVRDAALKLQAIFLDGSGLPMPPPPMPTVHRVAERITVPANSDTESPRKSKHDKKAETNPPINVTLALRHDHPHLTNDRRLSPETCKAFGVGYCNKGIMSGLIAIPIHDEVGQLVAYAGRRLRPSEAKELGKYKLPQGFKKERVLYNLHRALPHSREQGLVLVEGFFKALKLYEAGFANVVAVMGCDLSDHQANLLANVPSVTILFDGNEAGWAGAEAAQQKLDGKVKARIIRLPDSIEPDDLSPRALRWLLNGCEQLDLAWVSFVPWRSGPPGTAHPTLLGVIGAVRP